MKSFADVYVTHYDIALPVFTGVLRAHGTMRMTS